ncbi:hypothetical protein EWM64_g10083 [Hericium alpestre]|uniref:AB hydrolase-1 domain-containing protein n=1 Tax=Hericium alpestre TaxID=135208 RepID=A0A4Y9ZIA9_9AGAM|nr:hypothetical protein EWM64_g10083 [Hericium alpestre]
MPRIESESFIFDPRPHFPLLISVKRYWSPGFESTDEDAITLVLMHATGSHNESWEPVLEELYSVNGTASSISKYSFKIREAWAIECPNHGSAAALNEEALRSGYQSVFPWADYARAVHLVLTGFGKGIDVDFRSRRLVAVGHSMGAVAAILARTYQPSISWSAAILIEPLILAHEVNREYELPFFNLATQRTDIWPSREEAGNQFRDTLLKDWDPRIIDLYLKYSLREAPTAGKATGVALKCTKSLEAATWRDTTGRIEALGHLSAFCNDVPTHAVFGSISDFLPAKNRDLLVKQGAAGNFKTVTEAVQTNPQAIAESMWIALIHPSSSYAKAKL